MATATPPLAPSNSPLVSSADLAGGYAGIARPSEFATAVDAALRESRAFLCVVVAQVIASGIVCTAAGRSILAGPLDAYTTFFGAELVFCTMARLGALFTRRVRQPPSIPIVAGYRLAWRDLRGEVLSAQYFASVAIIFLTAPIAISAFSAAKQAIPILHPFTWDAYLSAWGSRLDGGYPLWQRLQPVLGKPEITTSLDWFYHRAWPVLMLAAFVWTALLRPSALRRRFLFSYALLFLVVGTLMAFVLASAGPPYYAFVSSGHDPYAGLFAYLRSVDARSPLLSLRGEGALWYAYRHRVEAFGFGVSAMPSVHVASATLMALFGYSFSRRLGLVLTAAALCTFAASVSLGWHYALDGYVGAAIACVVWWVAGRLNRERA
jgi:hypothetical protein